MTSEKKIDELYESYNKELYIYIFRFTYSRETAEDILHDCFLNLIKYLEKNDIDEKGGRALLYKIAHNLCVNFLKRKSIIKFSSIDKIETFTYEDDVSKEVELNELNDAIYKLIDELDPLSKSIFIMRKELDMSYIEIAKNINKSERTVRRKMEKILSFLSNSLKNMDFF